MRRKSFVAVLVGSVVASVGVVGATSPASAASCIITKYNNTASDYARTTDASGGCSSVGAAHYFTPWGGGSLFTGWKYGGDVAQTGSAAELSSSKHSGS